MTVQCAKRAARECIARARSAAPSPTPTPTPTTPSPSSSPSPAPGGEGRSRSIEEVSRPRSSEERRLIAALKECKATRNLQRGRMLHRSSGFGGGGGSVYVGTTLVDMYARCGSMEEAREVFDGMSSRNVVSWTALILGYAENGRSEVALEMFERMESEGCRADARTFVAGIKACGNLAGKQDGTTTCSIDPVREASSDGSPGLVAGKSSIEVAKEKKLRALSRGRDMHRRAVDAGCEMNLFVANTLVDMYSRCGSLDDARAVFDRMPCHSLVSWTSLLYGCVENGEEQFALKLFSRLRESIKESGSEPDAQAFVSVLAACSSLAAKERVRSSRSSSEIFLSETILETAMDLHAQAVQAGVDSNIVVANKLIDLYSKCGSIEDARRIFDKMLSHDVVTLTTLILGYAENGESALGLELFDRLSALRETVRDPRFFVAGLMACSSLVDGNRSLCLENLCRISLQAAKAGCDSDVFVSSALVDLFAKCGSIGNARAVFDRMPRRDVVSWTSMLLGYVENDQGDMALKLYSIMQREGFASDARTYVAAIMACASIAEEEDRRKIEALEQGRRIHSKAVEDRVVSDKMVANSLVDMYSRCGSMIEARGVFDEMPIRDVVSWNSLLQGYVLNGESDRSLKLFEEMQREGCDPDARTFVAVFRACGDLAVEKKESKTDSLERGRDFHRQASGRDLDTDLFVANSLIDMYARCGVPVEARAVFDKIPVPDVVSWNTMLSGYADNGSSEETLDLYAKMKLRIAKPDARSLIPVLKACSNAAALETGKLIHAEAIRSGFETSPFLAATLVDLYGKCGGNLVQAEMVFDSTPARNLALWSALMAGYGRLGDTNRVLGLFRSVSGTGLRLDGATFCSVLTACSHAGLVDRGKEIFDSMTSEYGVDPGIEHYHCLIDLLGRADHLEEAVRVVREMPFEPRVVTWKTVLSACRKWQNVEIGKVAFEALLGLQAGETEDEEQVSSTFALMANIYAGAGMWEEQAHALAERKRRLRSRSYVAEKVAAFDGSLQN